jgi:hypothetical protein
MAGERGDGGRIAIAAELHDREFVAAEPRHRVVLGDAFAEAPCDLLQQHVADRMAKRVVDVLEVIEIETQDRKLIAASGKPQGLFELLAEQRPVRQVGQRVMARHVGNLFLGGLPFGDVFEGSDPSAALHRLIDHAKRASATAIVLVTVRPAFASASTLAKNSSGSPSHSPTASLRAGRQSASGLAAACRSGPSVRRSAG